MANKLTQSQRHHNELKRARDLEAEQLLGYWAKTKGFSSKALGKENNQHILQACRLAKNIIKTPGQHKEVYKDCNNLLARYAQGKGIDIKLVNLIYRHSKRIQRQQAKQARKATRKTSAIKP